MGQSDAKQKNEPAFKPLYTIEDAEAAMHLFVTSPTTKVSLCVKGSGRPSATGAYPRLAGISMEITEKEK